jgi:alpha-ketoglutarate-dependent taurine dioxygenase
MHKIERQYVSADWDLIAYHLEKNGFILLGENYLENVQQFIDLLHSWNVQTMNYIFGQSPRQLLAEKVYSAIEYPSSEAIPLHQELSYSNHAPRYLFFYCLKPATNGGETPLLDCELVLENCPKDILKPFLNKGIRYYKYMSYRGGLGKTWPEHFETNDREAVEKYLCDNNMQYEWHSDDSLSTNHYRKAVHFHPELNKKVWFAQPSLWHISHLGDKGHFLKQRFPINKLPTHVTYGNGDEIPQKHIDRLREWKLEKSMRFRWHPFDLLVIDNWRVAHGRQPFIGDREHWVAMGKSEQ